jgi:hypothetical protein
MRIRTNISIVIAAGVAAAIPLYLLTRPESPDSANVAQQTPVSGADVRDLYCAQRTPENGVVVNTGAGCAHDGGSAGPHSPTVTVTPAADALVITGADP